jgi:Uncharacterized ACR, COG1430
MRSSARCAFLLCPGNKRSTLTFRYGQPLVCDGLLDRDGYILNIADMQPYDEKIIRSAGPACCALEVNQGWFARNGVQAGDRIRYTLPEQIAIQ